MNLIKNRITLILIQFFLVFSWLACFAGATSGLPVYLLLGLSGTVCLWKNSRAAVVKRKIRIFLLVLSGVFAVVTVGGQLSLYEPLRALLSMSNIALSLAGSMVVYYQILTLLVSLCLGYAKLQWKLLLQMLFVFLWLVCLIPTDSRFCVYVFSGLTGMLCLCHNVERKNLLQAHTGTLGVFAGLFALATVLANYPIFEPLSRPSNLIGCVCGLIGGFFVGYHVLLTMMVRLPLQGNQANRESPKRVLLLTWIPILIIYLLYLFFACYPGLLTRDSQSTISQILGEQPYNNTMPFWHTITVQPFLRLGMLLSGTLDGGIALFHCVQALFMSLCFAYVLVTLYQIGVPKTALAAVFFLYAFLPFNIVYSATLWKDVPFSGAALLFVTGLFRLIRNVGKNRKLNYVALIVGAMGFSLWRTNGWYAFLVMTLVMLLLLRKKYKKLLIILVFGLVLCWVLINPVLDGLGVAETNLVEAFAVPMQQVARVVAEDRPLTQEQWELLNSIFHMRVMAERYNPLSVDPIKFEVFRTDRVSLITENPGDYLRLYFQLGIQYPADYIKAWVDETKGYWNGGYEYWMYDLAGKDKTANLVASLFTSAFRFLNETEALKLFASVGLYIWGLIGCFLVNVLKKREEFLLPIPLLVLVVGLWLGTPVFCEFRYAYPMLLTLPLIACVTMYRKTE